jgi:hypothetical protein
MGDTLITRPTYTSQQINSSFVSKLERGQTKEAADAGTQFIRTKLRQAAAVRELIAPEGVDQEDLDRDENTDQPKIIIDKEPDSVATYMQLHGTGRRTWFKGPRYAVYFGKIESQRFTKSKFELMTYKSNIRDILSENSIKDMADQEDTYFANLVDALIAANPSVQRTSGAFQSSTFKVAGQAFVRRQLPAGKMLMTKEQYLNAIDLPATSVGDAIAGRHFDEGIDASQKLWGFPVVTTIKSNIYDPDKAWLFAPQAPNNYLGNFFLLQDATLYVKMEADIVTFWSYECLGLGVANRLSVQEIEFA